MFNFAKQLVPTSLPPTGADKRRCLSQDFSKFVTRRKVNEQAASVVSKTHRKGRSWWHPAKIETAAQHILALFVHVAFSIDCNMKSPVGHVAATNVSAMRTLFNAAAQLCKMHVDSSHPKTTAVLLIKGNQRLVLSCTLVKDKHGSLSDRFVPSLLEGWLSFLPFSGNFQQHQNRLAHVHWCVQSWSRTNNCRIERAIIDLTSAAVKHHLFYCAFSVGLLFWRVVVCSFQTSIKVET